jgi:uncharacterized protein YlaN (UPF0358 family)
MMRAISSFAANRRFGYPCVLLAILAGWAGVAQTQQLSIKPVDRQVIEIRLREVSRNNNERQANLVRLFEQAGCTNEHLVQQRVEGSGIPNVICTLPGSTDTVIIVGAHFDVASLGKGVVDNWSGASLLPSLYESLSALPRKCTFIFIGFTAEEYGLIGSRHYAAQLTKQETARIRAMVNLDTLGLSSTKVEPNSSDANLVQLLRRVAYALQLALAGVEASGVGSSDYKSFADRKIPVLSVHSLTQESLAIIHSVRDNEKEIRLEDYLGTYRLIAYFLAALDEQSR